METAALFGGNRRLRVRERYLKDGDAIYVLGCADRLHGRPILGPGGGGPLILSDRTEVEIVSSLQGELVIFGVIAAVLLVVAGCFGMSYLRG